MTIAVEKLIKSMQVAVAVTKEIAEYDRQRYIARKEPKKQAVHEQKIAQMKSVLASLKAESNNIAPTMDVAQLKPILERLGKDMVRLMGRKQPPIYSRCLHNLKIMKGK